MKKYLLILDVKTESITKYNKITGEAVSYINNLGGRPDGICIDEENKKIYWSTMGKNTGSTYDDDDGSINSISFDGTNRKKLVGNGDIRTAKQIILDKAEERLYWCDREGGKISSCKTDGSNLTIHMQKKRKNDLVDISEQCVGIGIDKKRGFIYWTQKGPSKGYQGRIFRMPLKPIVQQDPEKRTDIELMLEKLPEPIDLLIDYDMGKIYWTDRGGEPDGNSLNMADITDSALINYTVICKGFNEAIGLTFDKHTKTAYVSDLSGGVYEVNTINGIQKKIYTGSSYTGICQCD